MAEKSTVWVLILCLLAAAPLFFLGGPDWVSSPLFRAVWDFGHIIFFSLLLYTAQIFYVFRRPRDWFLVTLIAFLVGVGIEWLQQFFGRDSSWNDVFHNVLGVWLGLFWGQVANAKIWILRCAALALLMPTIQGVINTGWLDWQAVRQFPLLNDFEKRQDVERITGTVFRSTEFYTQGVSSLKVELMNERYSGAEMKDLLGVWQGYKVLAMDFFNPDIKPLNLVVKITDRQHDRSAGDYNDRFNLPVVLQPGWNYIRIPIDEIEHGPQERLLNLAEISRIRIFASSIEPGRIFYWDYVRLE